MSKRKEVEDVQTFESSYGVSRDSSVRGPWMKSRLSRSNFEGVLPFTVNQGEEGTCVYVTLSKLLLFNLMGLVMDITLSEEEQAKITFLTRLFPIQSQTHSLDKYLKDAMISPESASPKGYALIVLFFYFFDWLKYHDMRPYYFFGEKVVMKNVDRSDFNKKMKDLFGFLQLTTKRLGGKTFSASGWIDEITRRVSPSIAHLQWKKISLCTLHTRFGNVPTFSQPNFHQLCDIIFDITKKFKIMLTVRGIMNEKYVMHEVMIVGIEGNFLLISNSWGTFLDKVNINMLPKLKLRIGNDLWSCVTFQFTFLLPFLSEIDFKTQYDLTDFDEFSAHIQEYLPQMDALNGLPQLDPALFDELASRPSASIGGTRKKRIKHGSTKRTWNAEYLK